MSALFKAMTRNDTVTENGMPTNSTSSGAVVDLFYTMGACRGGFDNYNKLINLFTKSLASDPMLTVLSMFYNRDIRGGQGERDTFRKMFDYLCKHRPDLAGRIIDLVPEYGRWDDIFVAFGTDMETLALNNIEYALLVEKNGLCAKWMPREGKKGFDPFGLRIMKHLGLTRKAYRKLLSGLSQTVENDMCANRWEAIKYSHVPSIAMHKYSKAFYKHTPEGFAKFILDVKSGKVSIKSATLYPHDLLRNIWMHTGVESYRIEEQWRALPDYVPEGNSFIPVCDVSGSMLGTPMDVSVALGIYLSERNKSVFKDGFITFSETPVLQHLKGRLSEKARQLATSRWGMNTNLEAVFELILSKAIASRLSKEDLPKTIIILSDMQFDSCVRGASNSAMQMIRQKYTYYGYQIPNVVFWNLRDSEGVPVKYDESGTALVSGFSPSIMKNLLSNELTPEVVVKATLLSERYALVAKRLQ